MPRRDAHAVEAARSPRPPTRTRRRRVSFRADRPTDSRPCEGGGVPGCDSHASDDSTAARRLKDALRTRTDTSREQELLTATRKESELLRDRHRRVRNAVNHGLPLAPTTLSSVREYPTSTSQVALNLALAWFIGDESGAALLAQEHANWLDRLALVANGENWTTRLPEQGQVAQYVVSACEILRSHFLWCRTRIPWSAARACPRTAAGC